jgi:tetratricopeptide (TPR) repeat protein
MLLGNIKSLINGRNYVEALEECEKVVASNPELSFELKRQKSKIFALMGKYREAVEESAAIIDGGTAILADIHLAAVWALFDHQFVRSLDWFQLVLRIGAEQNNTWFKSDAICQIAYISMELGNYEISLDFLRQLESDFSNESFLIPNVGFGSVKELGCEIRRRIAEKKVPKL